MTTPYEKVYRVKQSREEMLRKKREGMARDRAENPEKFRERSRVNHIKHRDNIIARVAEWSSKKKPRVKQNYRKCQLKIKYGMTPEQWYEMLSSQGNACAICRTTEPHGKRKQWDTDHCHTTGRVRGILCHPCNLMLGGAKDNPETLAAGIRYLIDNP